MSLQVKSLTQAMFCEAVPRSEYSFHGLLAAMDLTVPERMLAGTTVEEIINELAVKNFVEQNANACTLELRAAIWHKVRFGTYWAKQLPK